MWAGVGVCPSLLRHYFLQALALGEATPDAPKALQWKSKTLMELTENSIVGQCPEL